jgi:hypothetical protein
MAHWLGATQSAAVWQGNAHLPYCVLQWWVPQTASLWQGNTRGPGVAMPDPAGAAVGAGAGLGAGGGAAVGGGAVGAGYGCGAGAVA